MNKYQKNIFLYGSVAVFAFFLGGGFFIENANAANSISLGSCSGTAFSFSVSGDGADYYAVRSNSIADPTFYFTPVASPVGNCSSVYPDVCGLSAPGQTIYHNPGFYDTHAIWAHSCWYATGCDTNATHTSITCSAPAPSVTTGSASSIGQTSAVLNGTANANGTAGTATFMFTQSTSYPTCNGSWPWSSAIASGSSAISGTSASNYSVTLGNISPGTTYSFCAVATNSAGTSYGSVQSFTTTSPPTYSCSGTRPANTAMWDATSGLTSPASYTYSGSNTGTQCEFYCTSGSWNGSSCATPTYTCSGTQPANTAMWDATSGLTSPASYTYSGSNTGTQCEFYCTSGSWNGSSCTASSATVTNFKICNNSCTTGSPYSVPPTGGLTGFTFGLGDSRTLCACSGASDCTTGTNTQVMTNWSASTSTDPQDAVNLSTNAGYCTIVTPRSTGVGKSDVITATPTP